MKIRDAQLQHRFPVVGDSGVWTFNVNLVDPVTEFKIWVFAKVSEHDALADQCLPYCISEVALIDGSEVIQAMTGAEAIALYMFDHGKAPMHWHQELTSMSNYWCIPLTFGRHLTDPEYIFDPTKFRNPQLRITWNLSAVTAVGTAGSWLEDAVAGGGLNISVWAKVMEEGATPKGYLMAKELKEFTTAASGQDITYLPTDFDIRKLMVRSYKNCGDMTDAITNLKISQDEDKWIPVDLGTADFIFLHYDWFDEMEFDLKVVRDDLENDEHFGGQYSHGVAVGAEDDAIVNLRGWASNCFASDCHSHDGSSQDNNQIWTRTFTRTPFDTYCYPFGDQMRREDWLKVVNIGNLRLILTMGSAGYTTQVWVQQIHPY